MNTKVNLAGVQLKNPVMTCSGTFGSGMEYGEMVDLNRLGAVVTKGIANVPWPGNPTPRVTEVYGGMLNAIGLQGPGVDVFIERDIPFLKQYDTKIIVNVCGKTKEDYLDVVERLGGTDVDMLEINISCPNVKAGALAFGQDPKVAEDITAAINKGSKGSCKAAGDHEAFSQCDGYFRNGKGCGGRRGRRGIPDQYHYRNEDRYQPEDLCPGQ